MTDSPDPGRVLVSSVVRERCAGKGFAFAAVGEAQAEGFDEPGGSCAVSVKHSAGMRCSLTMTVQSVVSVSDAKVSSGRPGGLTPITSPLVLRVPLAGPVRSTVPRRPLEAAS